MILYIMQKSYTTKIAKGVDELNALALEGFSFVKAIEKAEPLPVVEDVTNEATEDEEDSLKCGICGKQYKREKDYLKHIEKCK